jgi:dTDP-4-dehydrorhamnose 3,5-epimerase
MIHKHVEVLAGVRTFATQQTSDIRGTFTKFELLDLVKHESISIAVSNNPKIGTIRGMHFQSAPFSEEKIVSCLQGAIFDVAIDLRPDSTTFGNWMSLEINALNSLHVVLPKGVAHGFQTLSSSCVVHYVLTNSFSPKHSMTINPFSIPGLEWPVKDYIVSDKDRAGMTFEVAARTYAESIKNQSK